MNQLNSNKLNNIFDVDDLINDEDVIDVTSECVTSNNESNAMSIELELLDTMRIAKEMLRSAQIAVTQCPDAESMQGASSIVNAVTAIIKELNSFIKMEKHHNNLKELENLRSKNREKLITLKSKLNPLSGLPEGSNLFLQQNNYNGSNNNTPNDVLNFKQENIVKKLIEEQRFYKNN